MIQDYILAAGQLLLNLAMVFIIFDRTSARPALSFSAMTAGVLSCMGVTAATIPLTYTASMFGLASVLWWIVFFQRWRVDHARRHSR